MGLATRGGDLLALDHMTRWYIFTWPIATWSRDPVACSHVIKWSSGLHSWLTTRVGKMKCYSHDNVCFRSDPKCVVSGQWLVLLWSIQRHRTRNNNWSSCQSWFGFVQTFYHFLNLVFVSSITSSLSSVLDSKMFSKIEDTRVSSELPDEIASPSPVASSLHQLK